MGPNPQETVNLVTFTEEHLMTKFNFCAVSDENTDQPSTSKVTCNLITGLSYLKWR